jgi:hypothetical protein
MHFLTDPLLDLALNDFDRVAEADRDAGDRFFKTICPGNRLDATDQPFERFCDYEELLGRLQSRNRQKYERVHKGTPFFFLGFVGKLVFSCFGDLCKMMPRP